MRIMLVASGDLWAGAEVMIHALARGLFERSDVVLLVVLLNNKKLAKELKKQGISIEVVDESRRSFFSILGRVRKLVAAFSPDVIHSHRYKENLIAFLSAFGKREITLVATQHGMPETPKTSMDGVGRLKTIFFFRLLSWGFDVTVLVSEEMRRCLMGLYGFSSKELSVIHNGISLPDKIVRHAHKKRVVVGSAGRLFPVKDFSLLVDIAHWVTTQKEMPVQFVIAGDGPQHGILQEKIGACGLSKKFKLLGHQDDMDCFYANLDIYINTSVHEGIPMSVLEAMAHGLPVVVPDVGGFPEIVDQGIQGYLVKGRNRDIYAVHMLELILNQNLREQMAKNARQKVVLFFSREAMVKAYYHLYLEKMGGG